VAAVALVALLAVGVGVALATGILPGPFAKKSMLTALYDGSGKLFSEAGSVTMSVSAEASDTPATNAVVKYELGSDLASSAFWAFYNASGIALSGDTVYSYGDPPSTDGEDAPEAPGSYIMQKNAVSAMNDYLEKEYGAAVDVNGIVKNGKFDAEYIKELGRAISEASKTQDDSDELGELYGFDPKGIDSDKVSEIVSGFIAVEANKEDVYAKFLLGPSMESNNGTTVYRAKLDISEFLGALGNYASERGESNPDYKGAADTIDNACKLASAFVASLDNLDMKVSITDDMLAGLDVTINLPASGSGSGSDDDSSSGSTDYMRAMLGVSNVNSTNLADDAELKSIIDSAQNLSE
jgi:hypothetical protein